MTTMHNATFFLFLVTRQQTPQNILTLLLTSHLIPNKKGGGQHLHGDGVEVAFT